MHELAKEYGVESKVILAKLKEMGEFVKSASSTVERRIVKRLVDQYCDDLRGMPYTPPLPWARSSAWCSACCWARPRPGQPSTP